MDGLSPREILVDEIEQINPAILLAEEFMRRDAADLLSAEDVGLAEVILAEGKNEIETVTRQLAAFERSPASSSMTVPIGF